MADDGHSIDGSALKTVVNMIKDMEFQVEKRLGGKFKNLIKYFLSGFCSS